MLATNEYFSVGGGFVVNQDTQTAENMYYMGIDKGDVSASRKDMTHVDSGNEGMEISEERQGGTASLGQPRFLFATAEELHRICVQQDMTIAQVIWENELAFRSADEIRAGLLGRE
jgi:hypothetical protein